MLSCSFHSSTFYNDGSLEEIYRYVVVAQALDKAKSLLSVISNFRLVHKANPSSYLGETVTLNALFYFFLAEKIELDHIDPNRLGIWD